MSGGFLDRTYSCVLEMPVHARFRVLVDDDDPRSFLAYLMPDDNRFAGVAEVEQIMSQGMLVSTLGYDRSARVYVCKDGNTYGTVRKWVESLPREFL